MQLKSNDGMTSMGVMLAGSGFIVEKQEADSLANAEPQAVGIALREYRNGRDLTEQPRHARVIDFCGLNAEEARVKFPHCYNVVHSRVKPERAGNRDRQFKEKWWLFGRVRPELRTLTAALQRYIATIETSKHRLFQFLDAKVLPDHRLIAVGSEDAFYLGVLSSRIHIVFSLAAGGTLEDRPVYNKSRCFDPFPFPDCTEKQKSKIRALAEELDAHRKRAQAQHGLGLTDIYNVLEKVRATEALTAKDKALHDAALVSTLKQLHDDLDAAVADAYAWPWPLTDAEILERVVTLNAARAAEEAQGHIRWLRPDYQKPLFAGTKQAQLGLTEAPEKSDNRKSKIAKRKSPKVAWPKTLAERAKAVEALLASADHPITSTELAKQFTRAKEPEVREILETLVALARAHPGDAKGTFVR